MRRRISIRSPTTACPRFAYEEHLAALTGAQTGIGRNRRGAFPNCGCVSNIAQRAGRCAKASARARRGSTSTSSTIPANGCSICRSLANPMRNGRAKRFDRRRAPPRGRLLAAEWRGLTANTDPRATAKKTAHEAGAELFTQYLRACRAERFAFFEPAAGTFSDAGRPRRLAGAHLRAARRVERARAYPIAVLGRDMERRYEAYKSHVVQPFFRDHFARLDRQIVLVDALAALNSGPAAMRDLETALTDVLAAFRAGRANLFSTICSGRRSTTYSSRRQRPIICITRAMTGSKRSCVTSPPAP